LVTAHQLLQQAANGGHVAHTDDQLQVTSSTKSSLKYIKNQPYDIQLQSIKHVDEKKYEGQEKKRHTPTQQI
jgi:hypothetical protein